MIVVHHLNNSRSQRVLWLLEELGLEYELKRYTRDPETLLAPASLRAVHPLGKSPVITDRGRSLAESGAIIQYLIERHGQGRLKPAAGSDDELAYTYWLHYAEGSAMPPLLLGLIFQRLPLAPMPFFVRPIVKAIAAKVNASYVAPQIALHGAYIEETLAKTPWFAGDDFSAADIQMSFPVEALAARGGAAGAGPNTRAWLERIHARPAWQRALETGGGFEIVR